MRFGSVITLFSVVVSFVCENTWLFGIIERRFSDVSRFLLMADVRHLRGYRLGDEQLVSHTATHFSAGCVLVFVWLHDDLLHHCCLREIPRRRLSTVLPCWMGGEESSDSRMS